MNPALLMKIEVNDTVESVAQTAAAIIAEEARLAVNRHGRSVIAVSGGHTPWLMFRS
jgi:6-phosphogluconolactonase